MGTRMEVTQLESQLSAEDYRKLQSLFLVICFITNLFIKAVSHQ